MVYELTNPSDYYTLESDDHLTACVAALVLGGGGYGLTPLDEGGERMPIFILGGAEEWARERFGKTLQEMMEAAGPTLAACLESVVIGKRKVYQAALDAITDPDLRTAFIARWHDEHRSSMNDIGKRARKLAAKLRQMAAA